MASTRPDAPGTEPKSKASTKGILGMSLYQTAALVIIAPFALSWLYKRALTVAAIDPTNVAAKLTAGILRSYSFDDDEFFSADGAPPAIAEQRKKGFAELGENASTRLFSLHRLVSFGAPSSLRSFFTSSIACLLNSSRTSDFSHLLFLVLFVLTTCRQASDSNSRRAARWRKLSRSLPTASVTSGSLTPTACLSHSSARCEDDGGCGSWWVVAVGLPQKSRRGWRHPSSTSHPDLTRPSTTHTPHTTPPYDNKYK